MNLFNSFSVLIQMSVPTKYYSNAMVAYHFECTFFIVSFPKFIVQFLMYSEFLFECIICTDIYVKNLKKSKKIPKNFNYESFLEYLSTLY